MLSGEQPHILAGDFNALTQADYSKAEWKAIVDHRASNSWEPPVSVFTSMLKAAPTKRNPGFRFVDAWQAAAEASRSGPLSA